MRQKSRDLNATCVAYLITHIKESAANTTAGDDDEVKSKPPPQLNPANSESKLYLGL